MMKSTEWGRWGLAALAVFVSACRDSKPTGTVRLYCSVDEIFGRQVVVEFEKRTGVTVQATYDSEAGKTTGLVSKIEMEKDRPQADVFWSSELFNTILLARKGLLQPYDSPAAADIPPRYRDPDHRWSAIGLRGRVIAFDPARIPADQVPQRWLDMDDEGVAAKVVYANPLFGTTRGHVAAMVALWGRDETAGFLTGLRERGAKKVDGNSTAVRELLSGRFALAATDTDDVILANRQGAALEMVYPDMGDGGTLLIPNSIAILNGAKNVEAARKLVDFLVSAHVEEMLARSASQNIPVRTELREKLALEMPPETGISYEAVANAMPEAAELVREILTR